MRILPESRRASAVLLLITVALAACALEFTVHVNSWVQHFVVYWLYNGLVLAAGVVCIARGLASARERAAWILIGAAVVSWGVGNTIWTFAYVDLPSPPYPSIADAFWLAVYAPIYIALLLLLRSRAGAVRRSVWLDGVIAGLAVAAVGTAVVFQAVLEATSGSKAAIATRAARRQGRDRRRRPERLRAADPGRGDHRLPRDLLRAGSRGVLPARGRVHRDEGGVRPQPAPVPRRRRDPGSPGGGARVRRVATVLRAADRVTPAAGARGGEGPRARRSTRSSRAPPALHVRRGRVALAAEERPEPGLDDHRAESTGSRCSTDRSPSGRTSARP